MARFETMNELFSTWLSQAAREVEVAQGSHFADTFSQGEAVAAQL